MPTRRFFPGRLLLTVLLVSACRAEPGLPSDHAASARWTVAGLHCPLGCSPEIRAFLQSQVGQTVLLGEHRFEVPFMDRCEGEVRVDRRERPTVAMLRELRDGAAPGRTLDAKSLQLSAPTVSSAVVFCRTGSGPELPLARLPLVEPGRILLQFEEQSLLELRPAPAQ